MAFSDILNGLFNLGSSPTSAPSAQLKTSSGASGSWGTPVITPQVVNPVVSTNTNTAPKTTAPQQQTPQVSTPSFSVPSGPSDQEIDSVYSPLFGDLSNQENNLNSQKAADQALIAEQQKNAEDQVNNQKTSNAAEYDAAQNKTQQQGESALSAAIRSYNALNQSRISRFGGSSSAGAAVGELAQQEFFKNQGNIQQSVQEEVSSLLRQRVAAQQYYDDELNRIGTEARSQLNELSKQYTNALSAINTNRSMLQAEKANRKLDVRSQYQSAVSNLQNQIAQSKLALQTWQAQFDYENQNNLSAAKDKWTAAISNDFFGNVQNTVNNANSLSLAPQTTSSSSLVMNRKPTKDDEFSTFFT
jgi:hypothetical protein